MNKHVAALAVSLVFASTAGCSSQAAPSASTSPSSRPTSQSAIATATALHQAPTKSLPVLKAAPRLDLKDDAAGDTTVDGATNTGADLIAGGFIPGVTGFPGEDIQSACNNKSSVNPILITNASSATQNVSLNMAKGSSNEFSVLTYQPQVGGCGDFNGQTGGLYSIAPGNTGVAWAMIGGGVYGMTSAEHGSGNWVVSGLQNQGWFQFGISLGGDNGFQSFNTPGDNVPNVENGPVGMNIVQCGATSNPNQPMPNPAAVIVNGDVQGSSGQTGYTWGMNDMICMYIP